MAYISERERKYVYICMYIYVCIYMYVYINDCDRCSGFLSPFA